MGIVFISYRRGDSAGYAGRLHESLEERFGRDVVFRDVDTIEPGQDFALAITERLRGCSVLLAVIGREWLDAREANGTRRLDSPSDYVRLEVEAALARADVLVIPVLVEGAAMPRGEQLPDVLRPLVQRQAVALHDEDWDAGVDRLASAIRKAGVGGSAERRPARPRAWTADLPRRLALPALGLIVLAALGWILLGRANRVPAEEPRGRSAGPAGTSAGGEGASGPAYDVAIPRLCEVVDGDLVYSVISASVAPHGASQELRVRVRATNDGAYDANFWDASFRLVLPDGTVLAPHSGLNEVSSSHSVRDAVVAFAVPAAASQASLRITARPNPGDIPLTLTPTGRTARDERADAGDVLARAMIRPVVTEPQSLLNSGGLQVTLTRVLTRRFANATRLVVSVRYANRTGYAAGATALTLRAEVGDQVLAPVSVPMDVIENAADASGDFVFDLPPSATHATLRAFLESARANVSVEL
ncbi:MAG: toll/interleukin-1 receptor domain-containing protein [Acidobacteriota bacterium]